MQRQSKKKKNANVAKAFVSVSISAAAVVSVASAMFAYLWHVAARVSCIYYMHRISPRLVSLLLSLLHIVAINRITY